MTPAAVSSRASSPFDLDLDDVTSYRRWRDWKLHHRARDAQDLLVDVADPRRLSAAEHAQLVRHIVRHGVAVYRSPHAEDDPALPRALGLQLGLARLDANWLADEDGLSRIAVAVAGPAGERDIARGEFIPYTDRAIGWHTDGYYHPEARRILGMILHCVRPAAAGGETALLDPELVYIGLRDESPALVRALMHPRAMTIPAREDGGGGGGGGGVARAAQSGPVFSLVEGQHLHMRYTARTRSIEWRDDPLTRKAVAAMAAVMAGGVAGGMSGGMSGGMNGGMNGGMSRGLEGVLRLTLQPGMGLVGHNVLHARSAFTDAPRSPRLLYRARYLDRVPAGEDALWT